MQHLHHGIVRVGAQQRGIDFCRIAAPALRVERPALQPHRDRCVRAGIAPQCDADVRAGCGRKVLFDDFGEVLGTGVFRHRKGVEIELQGFGLDEGRRFRRDADLGGRATRDARRIEPGQLPGVQYVGTAERQSGAELQGPPALLARDRVQETRGVSVRIVDLSAEGRFVRHGRVLRGRLRTEFTSSVVYNTGLFRGGKRFRAQ